MANVILNANEMNENEDGLRSARNKMTAYYAEHAADVFKMFVDVTDEEFSEFMKVTKDAQVVFTIPSADTLATDQKSENPRFKKGRKFGSVQWWKKEQDVSDAKAMLTSYSSYLRYMDSKQNAVDRLNKRIDNTANDMQALSIDEQAKAMAKMFGVSIEKAKEMLSNK